MTDAQVKAVNSQSSNGEYRVLFVKAGYVFMSSVVKYPDSLIRIHPTGHVEELGRK